MKHAIELHPGEIRMAIADWLEKKNPSLFEPDHPSMRVACVIEFAGSHNNFIAIATLSQENIPHDARD